MIIVKLMGGLGNQMFQYAAARCLSKRHGTQLKLDVSFFEGEQSGNTKRRFELDNLCITAAKASRWEVITQRNCKFENQLENALVSLYQRVVGHTVYCEKSFNYDHQLLTLPDNVYLEGYWQSEHYFAEIKEVIRKEFSVRTPLTGRNRELAEEIRSVNAVSLHVRRGDYVLDAKTSAMHEVCDLGYYRRAEERVVQTLKHPHFFIFSDDPEWAEENLKLGGAVVYVSHNVDEAHEDLRLMSLCRHHIIANSSFSWWGAWLAPLPYKLVIAPKRWFRDPVIDTSDLIPSSWLRI